MCSWRFRLVWYHKCWLNHRIRSLGCGRALEKSIAEFMPLPVFDTTVFLNIEVLSSV